MGGRIGKEFKRWGRDFDRTVTRGVFRGDYARDALKKGWDDFRESTGIFPKQPEPPKPPEPPPPPAPGAQSVTGVQMSEEEGRRRGRRSTRRVARTPLGGGAMLT